jgi:hypothetical protein
MRSAEDIEYQKWICATKVKLSSKAAAGELAQKRLQKDATLKALYTYQCCACGAFHLTRKKNHNVAAAR